MDVVLNLESRSVRVRLDTLAWPADRSAGAHGDQIPVASYIRMDGKEISFGMGVGVSVDTSGMGDISAN
jgi:hypothetical protein